MDQIWDDGRLFREQWGQKLGTFPMLKHRSEVQNLGMSGWKFGHFTKKFGNVLTEIWEFGSKLGMKKIRIGHVSVANWAFMGMKLGIFELQIGHFSYVTAQERGLKFGHFWKANWALFEMKLGTCGQQIVNEVE